MHSTLKQEKTNEQRDKRSQRLGMLRESERKVKGRKRFKVCRKLNLNYHLKAYNTDEFRCTHKKM